MKCTFLIMILCLFTSLLIQIKGSNKQLTLEDIRSYEDTREIENYSSGAFSYNTLNKSRSREDKLKDLTDHLFNTGAEQESRIYSKEEIDNLMNNKTKIKSSLNTSLYLFVLLTSFFSAFICYIIAISNNQNIYKSLIIGLSLNIIGIITCLYLRKKNSIISNTYKNEKEAALSLFYMLQITAALILVIGIFSMPIGYYTFLRIIISCIAAYNAIHYFNKSNILFICFFLLTVLYNPIIPIVLNKDHWIILNIITLIFGYTITIQKK